MVSIEEKIEGWKKRLLDLSRRNRLLNYPAEDKKKRTALRIKNPLLFELWESFVVKKSPLVFPNYDDEQYNDEEQGTIADETIEVTDASVQTHQTIREQQKTLRTLRSNSKTAMEEQGVHILYLSFGFLRWREDVNSQEYFLSPIVLVPVKLIQKSLNTAFELQLHDDEITINPTLSHKLSADFGINLPEFVDDNEENNLSRYLEIFSEQISKELPNCSEMIYEAGLSTFSFQNINMYKDLERHKVKIESHPIVRAITGDSTALEYSGEAISENYHDKIDPKLLFQVLDADPSQQDAILWANRGISFVLQGPPGTGKSQTISNIIAERLAAGKKVLFVAEKMAALEVVRKRLTDAGLADFCLTLHGSKINKKEVLNQLKNAYDLAGQKVKHNDDALEKLHSLQELKTKLNEYVRQIHDRENPLRKSIYNIYGELAQLESHENIIFDIPHVHATTQEIFTGYIALLEKFSSTIGKISDDYRRNPWANANITAVTHDLRHKITAELPNMLPKIKKLSELCDRIATELGITISPSVNGVIEICNILKSAVKSPKVPLVWLTTNDFSPLQEKITRFGGFQKSFREEQAKIASLYLTISENDSKLSLADALQVFSSEQISEELDQLNKRLREDHCYLSCEQHGYDRVKSIFEKVRTHYESILSSRTGLLARFERELFDIDYKAILRRFKTQYTSFFKYFNRQYKQDKLLFKGLFREIVKKVSDGEIIETLNELRTIDEKNSEFQTKNSSICKQLFGDYFKDEETDFEQISKLLNAFEQIVKSKGKWEQLRDIVAELDRDEEELKGNFDYLYCGHSTDWGLIRELIDWTTEFTRLCHDSQVDESFICAVCNNDKKIAQCKEFNSEFIKATNDFADEYNPYQNWFEKNEIRNMTLSALYDRVEKQYLNIEQLEKWVDFCNARKECENAGLGDYINKISVNNIETSRIIPVFRKRFYRLWLDAIEPRHPAVHGFRQPDRERMIKEFVRLDKLQFDIAKMRVRKKLIETLPLPHKTSLNGEWQVLSREFGKKRNMAIRKLFQKIPKPLLSLKPCLMMSPLTVSLYLEAESFHFDTIIFDEASQVCPEVAIGAILRGDQVIIAGDGKQLPPTNFFRGSSSDNNDYDNDEDEEIETNDQYESILDEANLLPRHKLLWHYRSRHEHLIAFSNKKFYQNKLFTFPANIDKMPDYGVEYIHVTGCYDRGGKRDNEIEANRVAELVFDHIERFPNRSLGIIAFSDAQRTAIETVLHKRRKENPAFEDFFAEEGESPFFIKNLENVQGDERDTIIFSIGYAKDKAGKFTQNFGPLNRPGGERRLNVAITRAKYNVKLVGSIEPTDISANTEGPKMLRSYIEFAIHGPSAILNENTVNDDAEYESPFEESVYQFLEQKGYKLKTQVGCSGYRIDMAVEHPTLNGQFCLGIECDGASYHNARTARERDRLRQAILEEMGWRIYRIWSTDWIKDPSNAGKRLIEAVEEAIKDTTKSLS